MTEAPYFTTLQNRGLIRISGQERRPFLQSLVTNDIYMLDRQPGVYACLLNAQGRFVHDFFITEKDATLYLDCEGGSRAEELSRRFLMYKLRAKVEISCEKNVSIYAIQKPSSPGLSGGSMDGFPAFAGNDGSAYPDTRHPDMGYRSFTKPDLEEKPFEVWDRRRLLLTIPDGSRDMLVEKSAMEECNIDKLNGVSYEKGCYVGQELTARVHYRGLAKKHLYTVRGTLPEFGGEITVNGETIGEMRSSCGDAGLALIKDERAGKLNLEIGS